MLALTALLALSALRAEPIKIGLVTSQTGDLRPWGIECEEGAQLAVDLFNRSGGFQGRHIQLLVEDDASKPEQAKSATEKLISEGCITILGQIASGISMAMKHATTEAKVPQIVTGGTRDDLLDGSRYMFRVCYTDSVQGPAMARFAFDQLHSRRIVVITDQKQPFSINLSNRFTDAFKRLGGKILGEKRYNTGDTQFADLLEKVQALKPDAIYCSGYFTEVGPLVRQAREAGIDKSVPFLGSDGWDSLEIINSGGEAILGSFMCNHYSNDDPSPRVTAFVQAFKALHDGTAPNTAMAGLGYDAAGLAINALKRAKSPKPSDMRDAIDSTVGYPGVTGSITLKGQHGNPPKRCLIMQLRGNPGRQFFVKAYQYSSLFPKVSGR